MQTILAALRSSPFGFVEYTHSVLLEVGEGEN